MQASNEMRKSPGPSYVSLMLIAASKVGIQVMAEIYQSVPGVFGMPVEWALYIVVTHFNGKGDIRNSSRHRNC